MSHFKYFFIHFLLKLTVSCLLKGFASKRQFTSIKSLNILVDHFRPIESH